MHSRDIDGQIFDRRPKSIFQEIIENSGWEARGESLKSRQHVAETDARLEAALAEQDFACVLLAQSDQIVGIELEMQIELHVKGIIKVGRW
jgi:hypothetical protein